MSAFALLALAACAQAAPAGAASKADAKTVATYQKPGIPVTLTQGKMPTVAPDETATVTLLLASAVDGTVRLEMSSKTDLALQGASSQTLDMREGETRELALDVVSTKPGRHYLDVTASLDGMDGTRSVSLPVQVGEGGVVGKSQPGKIAVDADGAPMIAMPAAETINGVVVRNPMQEQKEAE